jgi:DNA polymerase III delta prime subunit
VKILLLGSVNPLDFELSDQDHSRVKEIKFGRSVPVSDLAISLTELGHEVTIIGIAKITEPVLSLSTQNGVNLIQGIQSSTGFVAWNASGLHYVILDEVDLLTDAAMTSFKSLMNRKNVVFIMTTNHLDKIDAGIQNRSVLIDMNQPPPANWRPLLRRIYTDANLTPPSDATLDQVVQAGRGSARSIFNDVVMSANQARRAGQRQVATVVNIRS